MEIPVLISLQKFLFSIQKLILILELIPLLEIILIPLPGQIAIFRSIPIPVPVRIAESIPEPTPKSAPDPNPVSVPESTSESSPESTEESAPESTPELTPECDINNLFNSIFCLFSK